MKNNFCRWFSALAGLLLAGAAHATTYTVTNLLDGAPGSLRACIAAAQSGADTINFQPLYQNQSLTIPLTSELDITTNLTITGLGAGVLTISGQNHSRVFNIAAGATVTISQLTVSDGLASDGGGILNAGTLTLQNCTIRNNKSTSVSGPGGGIESSGPLTLFNCLVTSNTAAYSGGGIDVNTSALTMTNCTVSFNSAENPGGGGISIENLYISGAELVNCTIASNSITSGGGGGILEGADSTIFFLGCTISGNSAEAGRGGGVSEGDSPITFENTIVSGNSAGTSSDVDGTGGTIHSGGFNFIGNGDGADGTTWLASDQVGTTAQPLNAYLGALQDNGGPTPTMAPTVFSVNVIDRGSSFGLTTDQRGQPRPFYLHSYPIRSEVHGSDGSDIGAVELSYKPVLTISQFFPNPGKGPITNSGLRHVVVSWAPTIVNPLTAGASPPDHGIGRILSLSSGLDSTHPLALFKHPVRIVDHNYKIMDDMTDTDGVPVTAAFYRASTAISNPFVSPPITGPANNIMALMATLTGTNFPAGSNTVYWFEYGLDTNYGTFTVTNGLDMSTNPTPVSVDISGLTASTTYHYQLMASDSDLPGLQYGGDQQFTTLDPVPVVNTLAPTAVTSTSADLMGNVNPGGLNVTATTYFEWGLDTNEQHQTQSPLFFPSGNSTYTLNYNLTGLTPNTTYYYRIAAYNSTQAAYGAFSNFTTLSLPPTLLSPTNGADVATQSPTFTWSGSNGTTTYGLYLAQFSQEGYHVVFSTTVTGTSYTYTGILPTGSYVWYMTSFNRQGIESAPSSFFALQISYSF